MSETISIEAQRLIGFLCGCDHKHQSRVGSSPLTMNESILIDRKCNRQHHCKSDYYFFMQVRSSTSTVNESIIIEPCRLIGFKHDRVISIIASESITHRISLAERVSKEIIDQDHQNQLRVGYSASTLSLIINIGR
jgi:hypothetical protein